jgi:hypothetical protein
MLKTNLPLQPRLKRPTLLARSRGKTSPAQSALLFTRIVGVINVLDPARTNAANLNHCFA